jgi:hypothetical protein
MTYGANGSARSPWRFDSGRVCLDLVATAGDADRGPEPLAGAGRLGLWLVGARLVPAGTSLVAVDGGWVERFVELRGWVGQLVRAEIDGRFARRNGRAAETVPLPLPPPLSPPAAQEPSLERVLEQVNALAAGTPPAPRAVRDEGDGTLVRALAAGPECGQLLAAVARDAVELLTDPFARARLRQCEGESCRRVYLDTSRGHRRRWCSSEVCGNRERVARHRRRAAAVTRA